MHLAESGARCGPDFTEYGTCCPTDSPEYSTRLAADGCKRAAETFNLVFELGHSAFNRWEGFLLQSVVKLIAHFSQRFTVLLYGTA